MHCQEFEYRLNAVLDERGTPEHDSQLAAHARQCESCRQLLLGQRAILSGLRQATAPALGSTFSQRVVSLAVSDAPAFVNQRSRRVWLALGALLTSAAAALLVVSLVWYARRTGPAIANAPRHQVSSGVASDRQKPRNSGAIRRGRGAMPAGYSGGLALAQPGWLVEAPRIPEHLQSSIGSLPEALPETMDQLNHVEQIAPGIRPIRLSLSALWDALCHVFSGRPKDSSQPTPISRRQT